MVLNVIGMDLIALHTHVIKYPMFLTMMNAVLTIKIVKLNCSLSDHPYAKIKLFAATIQVNLLAK